MKSNLGLLRYAISSIMQIPNSQTVDQCWASGIKASVHRFQKSATTKHSISQQLSIFADPACSRGSASEKRLQAAVLTNTCEARPATSRRGAIDASLELVSCWFRNQLAVPAAGRRHDRFWLVQKAMLGTTSCRLHDLSFTGMLLQAFDFWKTRLLVLPLVKASSHWPQDYLTSLPASHARLQPKIESCHQVRGL